MTEQETWMITGANRGLGLALTRAALGVGAHVVATTRGGTMPLANPRLTSLDLDVRDATACRDVVAQATDLLGSVDVLVNNAGYGLVGAIEETSDNEAADILETDLLGPLRLSREVMAHMRARGRGHIVQISSVGGVGAMPFFGLYNAAKWGLEGFSEALAGEAATFGVRVTLAEIGAMNTEWATGSMRFSQPLAAYDNLRTRALGSPHVPWVAEAGATGGGSDPDEIAARLVQHVRATEPGPLRLILGDDAGEQIRTVLDARLAEYAPQLG